MFLTSIHLLIRVLCTYRPQEYFLIPSEIILLDRMMRDTSDLPGVTCETVEGQLLKYTNVVKGFQYRWFLLDAARGTLEYFMPDERRRTQPRGCVHLAGCMIIPSEEDSQTFNVSVVSGEVYKLKASDAQERLEWVNRLRQVALLHENQFESQQTSSRPEPRLSGQAVASMNAVRTVLLQTTKSQKQMSQSIEAFTATDSDLLLMKATSLAAVNSLESCFSILQTMQRPKM